jgi:hypothetical protein
MDAALVQGVARRVRKEFPNGENWNNIVNAQGELGDTKMVAPLWNLMRSEFMTVMRDPLVVDQNKFAEKAHRDLYASVNNLIATLEKIRNDLARKHGEVWEDETLTRTSDWGRPEIADGRLL